MQSKKVPNLNIKKGATAENTSEDSSDTGILTEKSVSQKSNVSQVSHRMLSARAVARF